MLDDADGVVRPYGQDAEAKVEKLKEEALLAAEAAEAKKASADDKAESSKNLSEAALIRFVYHQIVLGARIRNH